MTRVEMMNALDEEISRLRHVRQLLEGSRELTPRLAMLASRPARQVRVMSPEGRRRIAEAQKRRWARVKGL